jgi:hypothetical protein
MRAKNLRSIVHAEDGIETVEWIAMASVVALMIAAAAFVLVPGGTQVGETVRDGILCWAGQIGGGGSGGCGGQLGNGSVAQNNDLPPGQDLNGSAPNASPLDPGSAPTASNNNGARAIVGTPDEQRNTSTPLPPDGNQCTASPDSMPGLYDFSWACYAHDLCYQNHSVNGVPMSRSECDSMFLTRMLAECDSRHSWWNPARYACRDMARTYFLAVRTFGGWAY